MFAVLKSYNLNLLKNTVRTKQNTLVASQFVPWHQIIARALASCTILSSMTHSRVTEQLIDGVGLGSQVFRCKTFVIHFKMPVRHCFLLGRQAGREV